MFYQEACPKLFEEYARNALSEEDVIKVNLNQCTVRCNCCIRSPLHRRPPPLDTTPRSPPNRTVDLVKNHRGRPVGS